MKLFSNRASESIIEKLFFISIIMFASSIGTYGQETEKSQAPSILTMRANENYSTINKDDSVSFFLKSLKYMSLDKKGYAHLTVGGGYRARLDHTSNVDFSPEDETAYLQRLNLHFALDLGKRIRVFSELYHGYSSFNEAIVQTDDIDFHQAFVQFKVLDQGSTYVNLRLGRQEMGYGASRLIGIRNGPNIRRSFDLAHLLLQHDKARVDLLYGKEVFIQPDAFDNESGIFDADAFNPTIWGAYFRHPLYGEIRMVEIYYLGFHSNASGYSDVFGEETRHSFGLRSFGSIGRFTYNTEFIVQTGDIAGNDVFATNLEADWKYSLSESGWRPMVGLKLDWSSGDKELDDGKIQTFNPMFVNPGLYSLAGVNTPINLTSLHPSITFFPAENFSIYIDYAFFYRTRDTDGFYSPPRSLTRDASQGESRHLGDVIGLMATYELNRNISFDMLLSYFIAGEFIEESGDSENILFLAPTVTINF